MCDSYLVTCTSAQVANFDLKSWQLLVRDQLPEGSVYVAIQGAQSAADVWLVWRDPAVASSDESPAVVGECPNALSVSADPSVRCGYFRINL